MCFKNRIEDQNGINVNSLKSNVKDTAFTTKAILKTKLNLLGEYNQESKKDGQIYCKM